MGPPRFTPIHTSLVQAKECAEELKRAFAEHEALLLDDVRDRWSRDKETANTLSFLLQHSVRPTYKDLGNLVEVSAQRRDPSPDGWFNAWCMRTVVSAANPFIPGMALSKLLTNGAEIAPEGRQRDLLSLRDRVDALLLEVLERLPKTVQGFPGGLEGCATVFEPEGLAPNPGYLPGPLTVMLEDRRQVEAFSVAPLIMDFLALVFKKGLPELWDTNDPRGEHKELEYLRGKGGGDLVIGRSSADVDKDNFVGSFLQGTNTAFGKATLLPGGQFIAAGVVAKPASYYHVPAMRMLLDLLVYLGMLAFFCYFVLLYDEGEAISEEEMVVRDDTTITWGEIAFAVYVVVSPDAVLFDIRIARARAGQSPRSSWTSILNMMRSKCGSPLTTLKSAESSSFNVVTSQCHEGRTVTLLPLSMPGGPRL